MSARSSLQHLQALPTEVLRTKLDRLRTFSQAFKAKREAGQDPAVELAKGAALYELIVRELRRRQSDPHTGLMEFIRYFWPVLEPVDPFVEGWAIECLCAHLQAITRGDTIQINGAERRFNRLLANVCPGFMKSLCVNVLWPAHEWGPMGMPHLRYVAFSYASELTERDNAKFRDLVCSEMYRELWGHVFTVVGDGKVRVTNDKTGFKFASSLGGVGTGERGHRVLCLPGSELILTDQGWLPIGEIVEKRLAVRIAGYDHAADRIAWQQIEAYERNPGNEILEITCAEGTLRCTRDHPVYVPGHGYARADSLRVGNSLLWASESDLGVPALRRAHPAQTIAEAKILQSVMPHCRGKGLGAGVEQQTVRGVRNAGLSPPVASRPDTQASVLQPQVPRNMEPGRPQLLLSRGTNASGLQVVWQTVSSQENRRTAREMLLSLLRHSAQVVREWASSASYVMLRMWTAIQTATQGHNVLLSCVREYGPLSAHEWQWQWPLCSWTGSAPVSARLEQAAQGSNQSARRQSLSDVWAQARQRARTARAPHQLRQRRPETRELDHAVPVLSRQNARLAPRASPVEATPVLSVKEVGREDVVYNVRVAPHHNYFAGGVLVHNCDDPNRVKGTNETDEARAAVAQWAREAMQNRLNDLSRDAIVVIQQRLHENDVSGTILEHLGDEYCFLCVPMEYEAGRHFSHYTGWNDGQDPRQHDGELAWPERYPAHVLQSYKRNQYLWSGQYQQNPIPRGGGIFKEDWWREYEVPKDGIYDFIPVFTAAFLDTAFKEEEENDYSALVVLSVYDAPKTGQRRIMLTDAWKKRLPLHGVRTERNPGEDERAYLRRASHKWGLCEWTAFTCQKRGVERLVVEDSARGHDVNAEIRRLYANRDWGVVLMPARGDKWSRANAVVDLFVDDMIYAPGNYLCSTHNVPYCKDCPSEATAWYWRDFVQDVINEMCSFPRGAHDDLVDAFVMGLRHLREIGMAVRREEREILEREMAMFKPRARSPALYPC